MHSSVSEFLFKETVDDSDTQGTRKYDQILGGIKSLLSSYPDYKIYLTGHSLGGALSSILGIYFACNPDLPKPITCINFGSPKVGGWKVLQAVHYLEQKKLFRILRCVNKNDCIIALPRSGYWHFGFQVTSYLENESDGMALPPQILHMNPNDCALDRLRKTWNNSLLMNINFRYDHADYIQRIENAKQILMKTSLDALYAGEANSSQQQVLLLDN